MLLAGKIALVTGAGQGIVVGGHVILANSVREILKTPWTLRRLNRATGGALVGAGVVVATR